MSRYKQQENEPCPDTEMDSWSEGNTVRVYSPSYKRMVPRNNVLSVLAMSIILSLSFGVLIGYFGHAIHHPEDHCLSDTLVKLTLEAHDKITNMILSETQSINIKNYLHYLTKNVHVAGTKRQEDLAHYIYDEWKKAGLDEVHLDSYDVLLNYPDQSKPNQVSIVDTSNNVLWVSSPTEKSLRYDENDPNTLPPFNAFSASGSVLADLVYVNYGRMEDYIQLISTYNISLSGRIAIARYGKNFRGDKVENARKFNMSGVILYTDPKDTALDGFADSETFPNSWWMPDTGVQRGTVSKINGDILTPGYPSKAYMYRELPTRHALPKIPSYPLSYGDAIHLLRSMDGPVAPVDWRGTLNITYRLGPGFRINDKSWHVKLDVNLVSERRLIHNVIGRIEGDIEPDRYVILGNHRDAWTFGAVDPSSGTACLCETARVLGLLHSQMNWKPRRTIIFASWDAEEYTLVGSVEYVENNIRKLKERAVAYLNIDSAIFGNNSLRMKASPLLYQAIYDVAKLIPNPNPEEIAAGRPTVYDTWLYNSNYGDLMFSEFPLDDHESSFLHKSPTPRIHDLGGGTDFLPFINLAGVSSLDIRYENDWRKIPPGSYPLYHTRHDTFYMMSTFIDPTFSYHKAVSQYWSEMARTLADSYVLPFYPVHYAFALKGFIRDIMRKYEITILKYGLYTDILNQAITNFTRAAEKFQRTNCLFYSHDRNNLRHNANSKPAVNPKTDPLKVRALNDKLMSIERGFLDTNGLPHKPWYKHLVMAPSSFNFYSGSGFPALNDLLYTLEMFTKNENIFSSDALRTSSDNMIHDLIIFASATSSSLNSALLSNKVYYELANNETLDDRTNILYHSNHFDFTPETTTSSDSNLPSQNDFKAQTSSRPLKAIAAEQASLDFENPRGYNDVYRQTLASLAGGSPFYYAHHQSLYNPYLSSFKRELERKATLNSRNREVVKNRLLGHTGDKTPESVNILLQTIKKHITVLAYTIKATADLFED